MFFGKTTVFSLCLTLGFLYTGCGKNSCNTLQTNPFQYIATYTQYPGLTTAQGYVETDQGGLGGLIIVNTTYGIRAYDRLSTVNPEGGCRVVVEDGGQTALDPCSQARYMLINGAPASIAECPLREYSVSYQQNGVLVSN